MSPRWTVFANPAAGARAVEPAAIENALANAGVDFEMTAPVGIEEMRFALGEAVQQGVTHLAVVGGDGTANLAANVLLQFPRPRRPVLGVIPSGTGCDLLRTFGISSRLTEAVTHLLGDTTYAIDVGVLEGTFGLHYFVNVAQAGVGAAAAQTAASMSRRWGRGRYPLAFAARLPGFQGSTVKVDLGERHYESPALAVIFANGQFFAGGWNVAPRSAISDGRLDLQVINCAKWEAVRLVPKVIRGLHLTDRAVRRFATHGLTLETEHPWPIEADGDVVGNTPVRVSVEPGAITLKI